MYVSRPTGEIPTWVKPGDILTGSISMDKTNNAVTSMKLVYVVPPKSEVKKASETKNSKDDDDEEKDTIDDVIFQAKLKYLTSIRSDVNSTYKELADALREEKPSSIPLLTELLAFATKGPKPSSVSDEHVWRSGELEQVYFNYTKKANGGPIDDATLAQYFGMNQPDEDELKDNKEAKKLKKDMTEQRKFLRKILFERSKIQGELAAGDESSINIESFDNSVKEMKKWVGGASDIDGEDEKTEFSIILSRHARLCQNKKVTSISILLKATKDCSDKSYKELSNELLNVYESFGNMKHLIANSKDDLYNRFPVTNVPL